MINKIIQGALICILLLMTTASDAQTLSELNTYVQKVRIGLVDEFFDRFNGKELHPDIPATKENSRKDNLMMLFNLSQFSSKNDNKFAEASEMMDVVIKNSTNIHFSDSTWVALAHCKGTMNGKSVKFNIFLTVQQRKKNMYKWVITKADGRIFDITPNNTNDNIMLYPDDHETNFLSLKRMSSEQPCNVLDFTRRGFRYDMTSVFTYLIYNCNLKIDYVDELEFIFTQVPGYIFHLKYFEREKNNAGWLISKFYKASEQEKSVFLNTLYHNADTAYTQLLNDSTTQKNYKAKEKRKESCKNIFIRRQSEKLAQIDDYIKFMQQKYKTGERSLYYKLKMTNLFVEDAIVTIYDSKKDSSATQSINDFCDFLIKNANKDVNVDSITVAIWDDKINTLPSSVNRCELSSYIRPYIAENTSDSIIQPNSKQLLAAYKEDTEDGIEWIPLFGNIVVTIK